MPATATKKIKSRAFDFSNVKDRGAYNPKHVDAGDYVATIVSVEEKESNAGNDMWVYGFQLEDLKSAVYPYYCILDPDSLWKIRNVFEAAGVAVPKRKVNVDPNKIVGKKVLISLEDDEYDGKPKSVIQAVMNLSELDGASDPDVDEDEDDEPPARTRKTSRRKPEPEPEPEDDDEDDDESEEEPEPPKRRAKAKATTRRKPAPVEDDDEDEDDSDEDEDEPPARKSRAKAKAPARTAKSRKARPSEEDDENYDEMDVDDL